MTSSVSETRYTGFDVFGRLLSHEQVTDGQTYATSYVYNLSGALMEETYPSGRKVRNTLDTNGDLSKVETLKPGGAWEIRADSFAYDSAGAVTAMRLGNNRWETAQYNSRLQVTRIGLGTAAGVQDVLRLDYGYATPGQTDNNGSLREQTITVPTVGSNPGFTAVQTYTYDSLNRLKDAKELIGATQTWKQTFTFDRYGNRNFDQANTTYPTSFAQPNITNPTVNQANNRFAAGQGWAYDASGNTTADANGQTFIYNAENKQIEVRDSSSATIGQYFYDGDGKRVKKIVPSTGETTVFVYDAGGKLVAEYSTVSNQAAGVKYLTADHLGSPRIITDQNGAVVSRRDFHPYGEEIFTAQRTAGLGYAADAVRQKFTGYERDIESDLDFAQARMYLSKLGRFNSTDPLYFQVVMMIDPQRFNLYGYARNNPLMWTDPDGEEVRIAQGSSMDQIFESVGGQANFDQYFEVKNGLVTLKDGVDISNANQGVQFLNELVSRSEIFLVYSGTDSTAVAKLFAGSTNADGSLTDEGKRIQKAFENDGYIANTRGRPGQAGDPAGDVFAVVAINPESFSRIQEGVSALATESEAKVQETGLNQGVKAASLLIHELAENLDFARNGTGSQVPPPNGVLKKNKATKAVYNQQLQVYRNRGARNYLRAHGFAIGREIQIRGDAKVGLTGGFAGGRLGRP